MPRIFVRGITSEDYGLKEFRRRQLEAQRVRQFEGDDHDSLTTRGSGTSAGDEGLEISLRHHIDPADDPFLTQTINVYFQDFPPHTKAGEHGHQNEAAFYIIEGSGYEIHDGQRYDWSAGDVVIVHTDSVHSHHNPGDSPATVMVMKAKASWMFLGLVQQGRSHQKFHDESGKFGPRVEWSQVWTAGVENRAKVIKPTDTPWLMSPFGKIRQVTNSNARLMSIDISEIEVSAGSHSGKRWQMADEALFVRSGSGYSLQWEVEAEIDEKYYARIANEPTRHEFKRGETLYVPQNTVAQYFADNGEPLFLISGKNSIFRYLGYDSVAVLEQAPEYAPKETLIAESLPVI